MKKAADVRSLFKAAKERGSSAPASKYSGKSKEELLALLKAKRLKDAAVVPMAAPAVAVAQKEIVPKEPPRRVVKGTVEVYTSSILLDAPDSDDDAGQDEDIETANSSRAGLPAGFFDEDPSAETPVEVQPPAAPVVAPVVVQQPMAPPAKVKKATTSTSQRSSGSARGGSEALDGTKGGALPAGFFDDVETDAISRGIDLQKEREQEVARDWEAFSSFAAKVKETEKEIELEEETEALDNEDRVELEQLTYMGKLAGLLQQSDRVAARKRQRVTGGQSSTEQSTMPIDETIEAAAVAASAESTMLREVSVSSAPTDSAASEVALMLKERKKKRRQAESDAFEGDYTPLDPSDWRAKMF